MWWRKKIRRSIRNENILWFFFFRLLLCQNCVGCSISFYFGRCFIDIRYFLWIHYINDTQRFLTYECFAIRKVEEMTRGEEHRFRTPTQIHYDCYYFPFRVCLDCWPKRYFEKPKFLQKWNIEVSVRYRCVPAGRMRASCLLGLKAWNLEKRLLLSLI